MNQPVTVQSVDRDQAETTRRYDRAMAQGELELADLLERDIHGLLDQRNDLTRHVDA